MTTTMNCDMNEIITPLPRAKIVPEEGQSVFVVSDTHFDHKNIIKYCGRPFNSVEEMNETLVKNWNKEVKPEDLVLILGDVAYGRFSQGPSYWLNRLNGRKILIKANHDLGFISGCEAVIKYGAILEYADEKFLLVHQPDSIPSEGLWKIHGHTHNKNLDTYPLVNHANKTMNVSVELIDYKPINIKDLIRIRQEETAK
jgi:calcineurin-like phosphoesterase family protein